MTDYQSNIHRPRYIHTHQYVNKKIRRVRWQKTATEIGPTWPRLFATASWDEQFPRSVNEVTLWEIIAEDDTDDDGDRLSRTGNVSFDWKFGRLASLEIDSDINDLQFINENHLLFATGKGDLVVAKWLPDELRMRLLHVFPSIHGDGVATVGFSLLGDDVVSIGTNCKLKRLNVASMINSEQDVGNSSMEIQDAVIVGGYGAKVGSLLCVEHIGTNEVLTGNAIGQLQLWDLRQDAKRALRQLRSIIHDGGAVTALRAHPSQRHIVCAGYQTGKLAFWDLRNIASALIPSTIDIHRGPIWQLAFNQIYPSHLFTAGNDGQLCHLDASSAKAIGESISYAPWMFSSDEAMQQVKISNLVPGNTMPVNSVDIAGDMILAGVDDESVWMIKDNL